MASYLRAMYNHDPDTAASILAVTVDSPQALVLFLEALAGFALGMLTTAEGLASAAGVSMPASQVLDSLIDQLAMADSVDDALTGQMRD
jgi:hypothetical protein